MVINNTVTVHRMWGTVRHQIIHHSKEGSVTLSGMSLRHLRCLRSMLAELLREGDQTHKLSYASMSPRHAVLATDGSTLSSLPLRTVVATEIAYRYYIAGSRQAYGLASGCMTVSVSDNEFLL